MEILRMPVDSHFWFLWHTTDWWVGEVSEGVADFCTWEPSHLSLTLGYVLCVQFCTAVMFLPCMLEQGHLASHQHQHMRVKPYTNNS